MRAVNLLVLFILLSPSFANNFENMATQISKDPQLLITYGKLLQALPAVKTLPHPKELGIEGPVLLTYDTFFSKTQQLSQLQGKLQLLGTEFVEKGTTIQESWFQRAMHTLFSSIHNSDFQKVLESFELRSEYATIYGDLTSFNVHKFFFDLTSHSNLEAFSGRITINGKTYSLLEAESKKIFTQPSPKKTEALLPADSIFSEASCTFRLIGSSYHMDANAPGYFEKEYLFGPPLHCVDHVFVSKTAALNFVKTLGISGDYLSQVSKFMLDLSTFSKGANNFITTRKTELFTLFEKTLTTIEALKLSGAYALNSSEVLLATQLLQNSRGMSAVISLEDPLSPLKNSSAKLTLAKELLTFCSSLGDCLQKQDRADTIFWELNSNTKLLSESLDSFETLFREKCEFYVKNSNSNASCVFYGPKGDTLIMTAQALLMSYSDYLLFNEKQEDAKIQLYDYSLFKLTKVEALIINIEPFISRELLITYYSKLSNLQDTLEASNNFENVKTVLKDIQTFNFKIEREFFIKNADVAEGIRLKLIWHAEHPQLSGVAFELPEFVFVPVSANSDFMPKLLYLLALSYQVESLEEKSQQYFENYAANLPVDFTCYPEKPPLGRDFKVQCIIEFENEYPRKIDTAFIVEDLAYPALKNLDSRNLLSGDLSRLESVVGKNNNLKIKLKDVTEHITLELQYESHLPPATYIRHNESMASEWYEVYYRVDPTCPTETAYFFIPHPLSGLEMEASHTYLNFGDEIAIEIECNHPQFLRFSGKVISLKREGENLLIENHLGRSITTNLSIPYIPGLSINSSFRISGDNFIIPLRLNESKQLKVNKAVTELIVNNDVESEWSPAQPTNPMVEKFFPGSSLEGAAKAALNLLKPMSFGCIEQDIEREVSRRFTVPSVACIKLEAVTYQQALNQFEAENYNGVLETYAHLPAVREQEFYLANALKYQRAAEEAISFAETTLEGAIAKRRAGPYLDMAQQAYATEDYILAIYYAKYATIKAPVGLSFNWRVLLAVGIVGLGLWLQTRKKNEPLL
ncbi:MAG: hypothetical protein GOV00_01560 [Candidatus Altiarchaeota archaeon]|nr:hypothetical protein [Candidatus Altiarchaeota archaeon]